MPVRSPRVWSEDTLIMDHGEKETLKLLPRTAWVEFAVQQGELSLHYAVPSSSRVRKPLKVRRSVMAGAKRVITSPLGEIRVESLKAETLGVVKVWRWPKENGDSTGS